MASCLLSYCIYNIGTGNNTDNLSFSIRDRKGSAPRLLQWLYFAAPPPFPYLSSEYFLILSNCSLLIPLRYHS